MPNQIAQMTGLSPMSQTLRSIQTALYGKAGPKITADHTDQEQPRQDRKFRVGYNIWYLNSLAGFDTNFGPFGLRGRDNVNQKPDNGPRWLVTFDFVILKPNIGRYFGLLNTWNGCDCFGIRAKEVDIPCLGICDGRYRTPNSDFLERFG